MSDRIASSHLSGERVSEPNGRMSQPWFLWVSRVSQILSGRRPLQLASYAVASLPDAAAWPQCTVYVSNDAGGAVTAYSDGTNWRRSTDRAVVTA